MTKTFSLRLALVTALLIAHAAQADEDKKSRPSKDVVVTESDGTADEVPPRDPIDMARNEPKFNLGRIRLDPAQAAPIAQLQLTSSVLTDSGVTDSAIAAENTRSTLFFNGATLRASPQLGPNTRFVADLGGGLARFDTGLGYNLLNSSLGFLQGFGGIMTGQLGWSYRRIYGLGSFNDLSEHGVQLSLKRTDDFKSGFFLSSNYDLFAYFSDPNDRSRVASNFRLGLGYNFSPDLQGSLNYRLVHDDFTRTDLNDTLHEFGALLSYRIWKNIFIASSVSYLRGDSIALLKAATAPDLTSSDSRDLSNVVFGVQLWANIPIPLF